MTKIEIIIKNEENKLEKNTSSKVSANIIYNLIYIKDKNIRYDDKYKDIKSFFNYYIDSKKDANFGYDNLNYIKINNLIKLLSPIERTAIIDYFTSKLTKEFPEVNREWFVAKKHENEVSLIFSSKQYLKYPKAIFLFLGKDMLRVFLVLFFFFILISTLLLPAFSESFVIFKIKYENYSDVFIINHILNMLSLFSDLDNSLKISPLNWFGLLTLILGKILFILLVVNFFYIRITDKMSLK
jgi:hypothetical protein